jgi:two-component system response regulator (stage 0 sporulation protein A)
MINEKIRVLIVDDNIDFCEIMKDFLDIQPDIKVTGIAHDGYSAIEMVINGDIDIVLLDLIMPGLGGLDVLKYIKEQEHNIKHKPVFIVLTTEVMGSVIKKAINLGASTCITKPMKLNCISDNIRTCINDSRVANK